MSDINGKENVNILIVDDVEVNRFILRNIIMDMGYQPVLAENGLQALKLFPRCNPKLVLLDVAMPEMDGYELCKILKADAKTRDVPIIFISAYDDEKDIVKGFDCGGEDYITKPFITEEIKARVGLHLRLYESNRSFAESNRRLQTLINEQVKQIEQEKKRVLYALANVARENAYYADGHMERLQYNCRILASAMQLSNTYEQLISDSYIDSIELSVPLCDVGNVAIPMEILKKKGRLSEEETRIMRGHTNIGAKILEDLKVEGDYNDFIEMSAEIALSHHENWDGSGYPNGRRGNEIPLCAQIVAIVSGYCALTEKRTYRDAYDREQALAIMQEDAAVKYNPDIFEIFRKISRQLH